MTRNQRAKSKAAASHRDREAALIAIRAALFDMEPELRQIEGVLKLLAILGEAGDSVEPAALAALARAGEPAIERLLAQWRSGFEAARDQRMSSND